MAAETHVLNVCVIRSRQVAQKGNNLCVMIRWRVPKWATICASWDAGGAQMDNNVCVMRRWGREFTCNWCCVGVHCGVLELITSWPCLHVCASTAISLCQSDWLATAFVANWAYPLLIGQLFLFARWSLVNINFWSLKFVCGNERPCGYNYRYGLEWCSTMTVDDHLRSWLLFERCCMLNR